MASFAPRRFGSYILTDVLGEGGAGRVFRGYRSASGIKVPYAIKILLEKNLSSLRHLNQFRDEALLASRLKHPNVGSFIEFFEFHGQNAIVLEFIEGVGLNKVIGDGLVANRRLDLHHSLFVASQILEGLHYLQRNGVIHGDLSPGNVMIDREGQTKLIDFGLSKLQKEFEAPTSKFVQASLAYMSPKRLYERKVSASDDLVAFGIILWELLTGERYHADRTFEAICKTLEDFTPRDPKLHAPDLPDEVADFVTRCLNAEKETGYQSVSEARDGLRTVMSRISMYPDVDKFRSFMHERYGADFLTLEKLTKEQGEISVTASKDDATQLLSSADVQAPIESQPTQTAQASQTSQAPSPPPQAPTLKIKTGDVAPPIRGPQGPPPGLSPAAKLAIAKTADLPLRERFSATAAFSLAGIALVSLVIMLVFIQSRSSQAKPVVIATQSSSISNLDRGSKPLVENPKTGAGRQILVSSSPLGAVVYQDDVAIGTTPFRMPAQAKTNSFAFKKEGFGVIWVSVGADAGSVTVDFETKNVVTDSY